MVAFYTFLKYAKLWELQTGSVAAVEPAHSPQDGESVVILSGTVSRQDGIRQAIELLGVSDKQPKSTHSPTHDEPAGVSASLTPDR
jgi:hypothetical protein